MRSFLQRLLKIAAYAAAGVVIALAIAVGLFRLFLPRLPEYQEEIKGWASSALGMEVEFSGMDARWGLSGPELEFYDAELVRPGTQARVVAAQEVRVGVALTRLLVDRQLLVDRVVVSGTSLEVRQLEDGRWWVQGSPAEDLISPRTREADALSEIVLVGEDIEIIFLQPGDERPRFFDVTSVVASADGNRLALDADINLPDDLGRQLEFSATQLLTVPPEERHWDVAIDAPDVDLAGWTKIQGIAGRELLAGDGDVDLSLAYANGRIRSAIAEIDLVDISVSEGDIFDLQGRFEFSANDTSWLIAAEEFRIATPQHEWPESRLRAEASTLESGEVVMLDVRASYLRLDDLGLFAPWLGQEQQQVLIDSDPSGVVVGLVATLSDVDTDSPGFDVEAQLDEVGVAALGERPGLRGFSGLVRANRLGGRLEIRSTDIKAELPRYFDEPIDISVAEGTVIWRRSDSRTTVLSDGIRISNELIDSESSVQLTIEGDGSSPVIDLASSWSINDVAAVRDFIPARIVKPKLYDWLQRAFVQGSIPAATTSLNGPLDKFPFDNGEGRFHIEAKLRNLILDYHPLWPQSLQSDMEVVLENTRLYSVRNQGRSAGNRVVDARIEIPDLRNPVLMIDAFSTGTLETIRSFTSQSPIADVFGGHLERMAVSGDASFNLNLIVPLLDTQAFDFTARLRSNNGTLAIDGFGPVVTDLIGEVTISRGDISSESIGATFLGEAVTLDLSMSDEAGFGVVAETEGVATAEAIVSELELPLEGLLSGRTPYKARLLFPGGDSDVPAPFTIRIESGLEGLAIELPEPVGKPADSTLEIRGDIRFVEDGVLESTGFAENQVAWQVLFNKTDDLWDLDRGAVTLGGDVLQSAETRGLHISGTTSTVRLDDWLALSRSREERGGAAERIRSIDLTVEDFFAVGQHLQGHHVRVDRSARDWLVQVDGEQVVGSVFVPYDFDSDRAMVIEMERLHMPGDEVSPPDDSEVDPTTLPPITLRANDLAIGDRYYGSIEADIVRTPGGLEATRIETRDETFEINATGRWEIDDTDPRGARTFAAGTFTSSDVEQTMARLNFQPGIVSNQMVVDFDVDFSGGPRDDYLDSLDGSVGVEFGAGQLEEVEPGAGRMFGLLSVTALPRRLSLDFRDVFNKGFGFDKIAGYFRISDGEAYTCDLSLEGPAADIGIVGRASLVNEDYDQSAVISANFGNTLPIMGAVVAGPQAAAALLIFSQIFKKPLQEVGQVYYSIGGSWDDPALDRSDAEGFAVVVESAGCLADTE